MLDVARAEVDIEADIGAEGGRGVDDEVPLAAEVLRPARGAHERVRLRAHGSDLRIAIEARAQQCLDAQSCADEGDESRDGEGSPPELVHHLSAGIGAADRSPPSGMDTAKGCGTLTAGPYPEGLGLDGHGLLEDVKRFVLPAFSLEEPSELLVHLEHVSRGRGLQQFRGELVKLAGLRAVSELLEDLGNDRVAAPGLERAGVSEEACALHGDGRCALPLTQLEQCARLLEAEERVIDLRAALAEHVDSVANQLEGLLGMLPVELDVGQQLTRARRVVRVLREVEEVQRLPRKAGSLASVLLERMEPRV